MPILKVEITNYDPKWPVYFEQEANLIKRKLASELFAIYHVGSTSILNMPAKPIIDILIELKDIESIDSVESKMMALGFNPFTRNVIPYRSFYTYKSAQNIRFNCHIYELGDPQIKRHLRFRDYLSNHSNEAEQYANLKRRLALQNKISISEYLLGKEQFVRLIDYQSKKSHIITSFNYEYLHTQLKNKCLSNQKIIQCLEANLIVKFTHFAQYIPSINFIRNPNCVLVNTNLADSDLNVILDTHFSKEACTQLVFDQIDYFRNKNIPFTWYVTENDTPESLSKELNNLAIFKLNKYTSIFLNLNEWRSLPYSSSLEIHLVSDKQSFIDFASLLNHEQQTYISWISDIYSSDDPLLFFVSYENKKPIAIGTLVLYANVAGIYDITVKSKINHDLYTQVFINFLLNFSKKLGYQVAISVRKEDTKSFYSNLGFKDLCTFDAFTKN